MDEAEVANIKTAVGLEDKVVVFITAIGVSHPVREDLHFMEVGV